MTKLELNNDRIVGFGPTDDCAGGPAFGGEGVHRLYAGTKKNTSSSRIPHLLYVLQALVLL